MFSKLLGNNNTCHICLRINKTSHNDILDLFSVTHLFQTCNAILLAEKCKIVDIAIALFFAFNFNVNFLVYEYIRPFHFICIMINYQQNTFGVNRNLPLISNFAKTSSK
jgi:hypothetical protein